MTYSLRNKHCLHEFHVVSASDENTHIVTFEDTFQKPILICDSCAYLYDDYKFRQMQGISMIMIIDEYLGSKTVRTTKVVRE